MQLGVPTYSYLLGECSSWSRGWKPPDVADRAPDLFFPQASGQDQVTRDVTDALCAVLRQNALSVAGRPVLYSDDTYRHAWKTEVTDPAADDTCVCGLVAVADLRGRLRFSEMTPSYFCDGSAGAEPGPPAAPLDPGEVSEDCLVDCGRVRLGGLASALEACHAILGIGTCLVEKK